MVTRKFDFGGLNVNVVKKGNDIWFKGRDVATALGYKLPQKAIIDHVKENEKKVCREMGFQNRTPLNSQPHTVFINEPGLYRLIFSSKLESAEAFKKWVFTKVLPSIRKTGGYVQTTGNQLMLMNEKDLHYQIVKYIRKYHPSAIIVPGLGELQDTSSKRVGGYMKGYTGGQPDIIVLNRTRKCGGLAIELKTPNLRGVLSTRQADYLTSLQGLGYETIVSSDYDELHRLIDEYFLRVRVSCPHCLGMFKSQATMSNHLKWFHRINT